MSKSVVDFRVNEAAVECTSVIPPEGLRLLELKNKLDLLKVRDTIRKPILRCANEYFIIDTDVYYHYKEA